MKQLMTILLALTLALAACGPAAAEQTARRVETAGDADAFIAAFFGAHPEEMEGRWAFTPQMDAALAQLGGIAGLARQLSVLGAFQAALPAYEGAVAGFRTFHIPCAFSLARVDLILAVQDGRILERGTHRELMEQKGYYYQLFTRQYEESVWKGEKYEDSVF